jgi:hypothetical protein
MTTWRHNFIPTDIGAPTRNEKLQCCRRPSGCLLLPSLLPLLLPLLLPSLLPSLLPLLLPLLLPSLLPLLLPLLPPVANWVGSALGVGSRVTGLEV